uniref:Uncharacterized protein n=1 Tax=Coccidioides posadasii RMSCC 3488 TaxID=454284 RepID=A0A0J6FH88_COCPO|nr:hypothetical protein CPAG_05034 [Coccidioides posadasii RMSCC 3488]
MSASFCSSLVAECLLGLATGIWPFAPYYGQKGDKATYKDGSNFCAAVVALRVTAAFLLFAFPPMFLDDRVAASLQQSSKAARYNIHTLKRLQKAVAADPEIDLTSYFPKDYSRRLSEMRTPLLPPTITPISAATTSESTEEDIRVFLRPSEPTAIIFPLADSVRSLLDGCRYVRSASRAYAAL